MNPWISMSDKRAQNLLNFINIPKMKTDGDRSDKKFI
jgi:hypothetical protein